MHRLGDGSTSIFGELIFELSEMKMAVGKLTVSNHW